MPQISENYLLAKVKEIHTRTHTNAHPETHAYMYVCVCVMCIPHRDVMKEWRWWLTWHLLSGACMLLTWFSASFMIYPNKIDPNDIYSTSSFPTTYAKISCFTRAGSSCLISTEGEQEEEEEEKNKHHKKIPLFHLFFAFDANLWWETFGPQHDLFNPSTIVCTVYNSNKHFSVALNVFRELASTVDLLLVFFISQIKLFAIMN